ncbi:GNAT family N-acetyltransferase [Catenovulum sediminis]|uniref:GNAT family N-acetyltransferase n=1 Tax=Catenovulum sediminis TaxID=1740262 RepID=A0ABV1RLM3_9ALTE
MQIREASVTDIPALDIIRQKPSDNPLPLNKPISEICYHNYLTLYGKGWVSYDTGGVNGYVICSKKESSIWALFVDPSYQRQGIGQLLLSTASNWLYQSGICKIYLSTGVNSRAEHFYQKQGWTRGAVLSTGQVTYYKEKHFLKNTG